MTYGENSEGMERPTVGALVELSDVTGDWAPGTVCVVLQPLSTHVLVTVIDEGGRHLETLPVGYESIAPSARGLTTAPRRRALVA